MERIQLAVYAWGDLGQFESQKEVIEGTFTGSGRPLTTSLLGQVCIAEKPERAKRTRDPSLSWEWCLA